MGKLCESGKTLIFIDSFIKNYQAAVVQQCFTLMAKSPASKQASNKLYCIFHCKKVEKMSGGGPETDPV